MGSVLIAKEKKKKNGLTLWPEGERLSCLGMAAAREGLEEKVSSTNPEHSHSGFPYWQCRRRLSTTCGSNPHLMGQQRRDPTHVLLDHLYKSGN